MICSLLLAMLAAMLVLACDSDLPKVQKLLKSALTFLLKSKSGVFVAMLSLPVVLLSSQMHAGKSVLL